MAGYKDTLSNLIEIKNTNSKYALWFKCDGNLFQFDRPIIFGIVYIPPEYTKYTSDEAFNEIQQELLSFQNTTKYICLLGDFNARTGVENDFVEMYKNEHGGNNITDFVDNNVDVSKNFLLPVHRKGMDSGKNRYGNLLLNLCKCNRLFIVDGRIDGDKNLGKYTCRESSVVDYCIYVVLNCLVT